jgi:hypothetical protein
MKRLLVLLLMLSVASARTDSYSSDYWDVEVEELMYNPIPNTIAIAVNAMYSNNVVTSSNGNCTVKFSSGGRQVLAKEISYSEANSRWEWMDEFSFKGYTTGTETQMLPDGLYTLRIVLAYNGTATAQWLTRSYSFAIYRSMEITDISLTENIYPGDKVTLSGKSLYNNGNAAKATTVGLRWVGRDYHKETTTNEKGAFTFKLNATNQVSNHTLELSATNIHGYEDETIVIMQVKKSQLEVLGADFTDGKLNLDVINPTPNNKTYHVYINGSQQQLFGTQEFRNNVILNKTRMTKTIALMEVPYLKPGRHEFTATAEEYGGLRALYSGKYYLAVRESSPPFGEVTVYRYVKGSLVTLAVYNTLNNSEANVSIVDGNETFFLSLGINESSEVSYYVEGNALDINFTEPNVAIGATYSPPPEPETLEPEPVPVEPEGPEEEVVAPPAPPAHSPVVAPTGTGKEQALLVGFGLVVLFSLVMLFLAFRPKLPKISFQKQSEYPSNRQPLNK